MRALVDRFAERFTAAMGSETCFALSALVAVLWLGAAAVMGIGHWNATLGLGGNTFESTGEWFLGIAMLIKANQIHDHIKPGGGA